MLQSAQTPRDERSESPGSSRQHPAIRFAHPSASTASYALPQVVRQSLIRTPGRRIWHAVCSVASVFVFFSNRFGCLGSIVISLVLSALLMLIMALINGWFG